MNAGLALNREKSKLFAPHRSKVISEWTSKWEIEYGLLPTKYLGVPLLHKWLYQALYQPLLDKIMKRVHNRSCQILSQAGRQCLVKSILQNPSTQWLSVLPIPLSIADKMDRLLRNYLWTGSLAKKAFCTISWESTYKATNKGGLGVRMVADLNFPFMCKWIWKLISNQNCLWASWCKENFLQDTDFLAAKSKCSDSFFWKSVLNIRDRAANL